MMFFPGSHSKRESRLSIAMGAAFLSVVAMVAMGITARGGIAEAATASEEAPLEMKKPASKMPYERYAGWPKENWKEFNTLAKPKASPPIGQITKIAAPIEGDPAKGKELAFDRSRGGSCLACHILPEGTLPGNVGPDLSTLGGGARPDEYLYNYIYDPRVYNPSTVMPPWGAHKVFTDQEIRHMVAYLKTLTTPTTFKNPEDDPAQRPVPVEERDNLDPTENPAMFTVDTGQELFQAEGPKGQSCASCHEKPEESFKAWTATMPKYEPRMKKVLSVEEFITRHTRATTGAEYLMETDDNIALSVYLRSLANGEPFQVKVDGAGAKAALQRGEALTKLKHGQLNFACMDCHDQAAHKWIRGQYLAEIQGQPDHFPTYRTSRGQIWDLRKRFQWCNVAIRANELPADAPEYGDLELYLTYISNGAKISVPGIRH
jgi:sulfur-oxidizing protein SoxA